MLSPYACASAADAGPPATRPWLAAPTPLGSPADLFGASTTPLGTPTWLGPRPPSLARSVAPTGCVLPTAGDAAEPAHAADVGAPAVPAVAAVPVTTAASGAAVPAAAVVPAAAARGATAPPAGHGAVIPTSAGSPPLAAARAPVDTGGSDAAAGCGGDSRGWPGATAPSMLNEPKSLTRLLTLLSGPSPRCLTDGPGTVAAEEPVTGPGAASTALIGGADSPPAGASAPRLAADPRGGGSAATPPDAMAGCATAVGVPPAVGIPTGGTGLATAASINGWAPGGSVKQGVTGTCRLTAGVCLRAKGPLQLGEIGGVSNKGELSSSSSERQHRQQQPRCEQHPPVACECTPPPISGGLSTPRVPDGPSPRRNQKTQASTAAGRRRRVRVPATDGALTGRDDDQPPRKQSPTGSPTGGRTSAMDTTRGCTCRPRRRRRMACGTHPACHHPQPASGGGPHTPALKSHAPRGGGRGGGEGETKARQADGPRWTCTRRPPAAAQAGSYRRGEKNARQGGRHGIPAT